MFPLTSIDAVEYARGQISAMAYLSTTTAQDVHFHRLRNAFEQAGIVHKLRLALGVLDLMREVQELRGGYWLPTPLRAVPLDRKVIIVGSTSTRELQRHFDGVTNAGYARILESVNAQGLPNQELDNWLGLHVRESTTWSEDQIAKARSSMEPTIMSGNVQYFSIETNQSPKGSVNKPVWTSDWRSSSIAVWQGVILCREKVAVDRFRYFFGQMGRAQIDSEASTPSDVIRLQFGFAALVGKPFTVFIGSREPEHIIHLPANLPHSERQLMHALGVRDMSMAGKSYRISSEEFIFVIVARLRRLGCDVRSFNV